MWKCNSDMQNHSTLDMHMAGALIVQGNCCRVFHSCTTKGKQMGINLLHVEQHMN